MVRLLTRKLHDNVTHTRFGTVAHKYFRPVKLNVRFFIIFITSHRFLFKKNNDRAFYLPTFRRVFLDFFENTERADSAKSVAKVFSLVFKLSGKKTKIP